MSNEDIKVGDVCEVIGSPCPCPRCLGLVGRECVVVEPERIRRRAWMLLGTILLCEESVPAFVIRVEGEPQALPYERMYLRKRRPPADTSQWILQETMPRAEYDKWLDHVRQGARLPDLAES